MCLAKWGGQHEVRIHKFRNWHAHIGRLIVFCKPVALLANKNGDNDRSYLIRLLLGLNKVSYIRHSQHLAHGILQMVAIFDWLLSFLLFRINHLDCVKWIGEERV